MIKVINADVMDGLRSLPDESVHCVVTSPPYWNLRDYGNPGQIGLEATPQEFIDKMVAVFQEVRRVLRSDGIAWVNMGDTYAASGRGGGGGSFQNDDVGKKIGKSNHRRKAVIGYKPKDLIGMPWRLALALQDDGWWLRSDIIWHKPNPMPESCTDRPTKAHEYIFLLTKASKYYYDGDAIREGRTEGSLKRWNDSDDRQRPPVGKKYENPDNMVKPSEPFDQRNLGPNRNKRTVWTMPTASYPGAHYATFPPALPETCIKAGTSEKGCCPECGNPLKRLFDVKQIELQKTNNPDKQQDITNWDREKSPRTVKEITTTGWEWTCNCDRYDANPNPCVVLDPFNGHGTTGMVAARLGRDYIGIEINSHDCEASRDRIKNDNPLFNQVEVCSL